MFNFNLIGILDGGAKYSREFEYCNVSETQFTFEMPFPGELPKLFYKYNTPDSFACTHFKGAYVQLAGIYSPPDYDKTKVQTYDSVYVMRNRNALLFNSESTIIPPPDDVDMLAFSFGRDIYNYSSHLSI